ncbi:MAG: hypothetical protein ACI30K_06140, partial [Muribaculaceae bacterium]
TLAVITLTDPYRAQILAATADTDTDVAEPQFVGTRYIASASTPPPTAPTETTAPTAPAAPTETTAPTAPAETTAPAAPAAPAPPTRASPQSAANQINTLMPPISPISLSAHPPPRRLSAALS